MPKPQARLVHEDAVGKTVDRIVEVNEFGCEVYEIIFSDGSMLVAGPAQGEVDLTYRDSTGRDRQVPVRRAARTSS